MKRRLNLVLCAVVAAAAIGGCGGTGANTDVVHQTTKAESQAGGQAGDNSAQAEGAAGMEGWQPFDGRVKITVPVYDRSKEGYPAVDDNYWTKWVQSEFGDKWNIDVQYVAIPRNDVMTKYNLLIVGKETPTIMMEYDYPKVAQWASDGAMQPYDTEAFAKVAPTYYQKMVDHNQLGYTDLNGETYFVLSERPYYDATYTYANFYRFDWVEELGMEIPKNYEDYCKVLESAMAAGLTDTAPLSWGLPANAYAENFPYRNYPVDEAEWVMHSSLGTASLPWEPTKKLLKRFNELYHKGIISREFDLEVYDGGAGTDSQMKTDFINGKSFQYGGYMSANVDWLKAFYDNNPDARLGVLSAYTGYSGVEAGVVEYPAKRADNPFGMIIGFSSLATEDELKAAWMLMEWMCQEDVLFTLENGIEGVTFDYDADGVAVVKGDYRGEEMLNHSNNIDMTCLVHASKVMGTVEQSIRQITPTGIPQNFYEELVALYKETREIADNGWAYSDPVFAVAIESESEYNATLLSLWQEYYAQLVKCDPAQFDGLFEELSRKYLDAGYQEIMDERLAAYQEGNTTKLPR